MAAISTLIVSTFYMIAQMVGAGTLVTLLLKDSGITYNWAVVMVGILMVAYVVFGGMLATTWVQIVKAILLIAGTILLSILVLAHFHYSLSEFFTAITQVKDGDKIVNFLSPGLVVSGGVVQDFNLALTSNLSVGGLSFTTNNLHVGYTDSSQTYVVSGGAEAAITP